MKKLIKVLTIVFLATVHMANGQSEALQENVNLIKKNLSESKANIVKYEWIETITTFVNGEQKSVKQSQCYYSLDGQLTKVATGATTAPGKTPPGIRGKIAENKKEEMADYIEAALAKIKTYIPPKADVIQKIYADGKAGIKVLEPGKKFKLEFPDYSQPGDLVSITLDKEHSLLLGYNVNTFVEGPDDPISLVIAMKTLPDGTSYPANITFNSASKKVKIVLANSGYKVGAGH
jgi:hypothetical protein